MISDKKIEIVSLILFYIAILIEVFILVIDKSALINPIEGRLFQISFVLCVFKIVSTKYNLKEYYIMLFFFVIGFIVDQVTGQNEVIRVVAFIAASKNVEQKHILKVVLWATIVGVLLLMCFSVMGILGDVYLEVDYYRDIGIERRYCFGLGHPNAFHCMVWAITTLGIYLYFDKLSFGQYIFLSIINISVYILTNSRTGMISTCFSIGMGVLCCAFKKIRTFRWVYICGIMVILCCVAFSVYVACFNGIPGSSFKELPTFLKKINEATTGRILEGGNVGLIEKWRLFSDSRKKGYIDMGYIKLFYWYGIVPALLYIISIIKLVIYSMKKYDIAKLILILSFSIYTIMEAHIISPYFARNYQLMLFFGIWNEVFGVRKGATGYFWQIEMILKGKNV